MRPGLPETNATARNEFAARAAHQSVLVLLI
jgi:hypothetical protein